MKKIISKIEIENLRGKIFIGDKGETSSVIPHSNGLFPVWFKKHKREFYWSPIWMSEKEIDFI